MTLALTLAFKAPVFIPAAALALAGLGTAARLAVIIFLPIAVAGGGTLEFIFIREAAVFALFTPLAGTETPAAFALFIVQVFIPSAIDEREEEEEPRREFSFSKRPYSSLPRPWFDWDWERPLPSRSFP